jgi:predicted acyl esterase
VDNPPVGRPLPHLTHHPRWHACRSQPEAQVFETGTHRWRRFESWPPAQAAARTLYFHPGGRWSSPCQTPCTPSAAAIGCKSTCRAVGSPWSTVIRRPSCPTSPEPRRQTFARHSTNCTAHPKHHRL